MGCRSGVSVAGPGYWLRSVVRWRGRRGERQQDALGRAVRSVAWAWGRRSDGEMMYNMMDVILPLAVQCVA